MLLSTGYSAGAYEATEEGFPLLPKPYRANMLETAIRNLLRTPPLPRP